jgi:LDH2 family malate/lactate/ureidoglycolate dehydrogenase
MVEKFKYVSGNHLKGYIKNVLLTVGLPENDSDIVAGLMSDADLIGSDAHGVFRLPQYVKRLIAGGINKIPNIVIEKEKNSMAVINGDNGMGHLVMERAANIAVEKAKENGVAWVGANSSNHAGPASLYARIPLRNDMIGIYVAVGSSNHVPPWGGKDMLLSTNPIAITVPSNERPPIILDMATTVAAYGKVKEKIQRNEEMPVGWMIDKEGMPLTDPTKSSEGFLLPIGEAKGYGLALMFGILAGTLNGAAFGKAVVDFNADATSFTNTGHFIIAIDIAAFIDVNLFKNNIDEVWSQMKGSTLLPGFDEIRLPGERSHKIYQDRKANGVPIHSNLKNALDKISNELNIQKIF